MPGKKTNQVEVDSLRPALAELERAIVWAYARYGNRQVEDRVTVTIQTRGRKARCMGFFLANGWSTQEGEDVHQIALSSEFLNRPAPEIIATAVHETVHLICYDEGIKDCSTGGRHNKQFKEQAEALGLECAKPYDSYGYGYTSASTDLLTAIEKDFQPDYAAFALFQQVPADKAVIKTKAYICICEGPDLVTVRVALKKDFDAHCNVCDTDYVLKD